MWHVPSLVFLSWEFSKLYFLQIWFIISGWVDTGWSWLLAIDLKVYMKWNFDCLFFPEFKQFTWLIKNLRHSRENLIMVKSFFTAWSWEICTPRRKLLLNCMTSQIWVRIQVDQFHYGVWPRTTPVFSCWRWKVLCSMHPGRVSCNNNHVMEG